MGRGNLGDLAAFAAIADNLSFRAAAARLGVTPSPLSVTTHQLEEHVAQVGRIHCSGDNGVVPRNARALHPNI